MLYFKYNNIRGKYVYELLRKRLNQSNEQAIKNKDERRLER
jgi:5-methylcytosine-specific restriction endonuclease McrBC regulatory subunit McrC